MQPTIVLAPVLEIAPYCIVKNIARSFLLEHTFDCCAMSRARASGTGCIQAATKRFQCMLVYHQMSQNTFVSQQYTAIHVNER